MHAGKGFYKQNQTQQTASWSEIKNTKVQIPDRIINHTIIRQKYHDYAEYTLNNPSQLKCALASLKLFIVSDNAYYFGNRHPC